MNEGLIQSSNKYEYFYNKSGGSFYNLNPNQKDGVANQLYNFSGQSGSAIFDVKSEFKFGRYNYNYGIYTGDYLENPLAKNPLAKNPLAKNPLAKKPLAKKPLAKKPLAKKPLAKKPLAKKPLAKKPLAKKPLAKKPLAKKPLAKKPLAKTQTTNDPQLELRRRKSEEGLDKIDNIAEAVLQGPNDGRGKISDQNKAKVLLEQKKTRREEEMLNERKAKALTLIKENQKLEQQALHLDRIGYIAKRASDYRSQSTALDKVLFDMRQLINKKNWKGDSIDVLAKRASDSRSLETKELTKQDKALFNEILQIVKSLKENLKTKKLQQAQINRIDIIAINGRDRRNQVQPSTALDKVLFEIRQLINNKINRRYQPGVRIKIGKGDRIDIMAKRASDSRSLETTESTKQANKALFEIRQIVKSLKDNL